MILLKYLLNNGNSFADCVKFLTFGELKTNISIIKYI